MVSGERLHLDIFLLLGLTSCSAFIRNGLNVLVLILLKPGMFLILKTFGFLWLKKTMQNITPRWLHVVWVRSGGYQLWGYLCSPVLRLHEKTLYGNIAFTEILGDVYNLTWVYSCWGTCWYSFLQFINLILLPPDISSYDITLLPKNYYYYFNFINADFCWVLPGWNISYLDSKENFLVAVLIFLYKDIVSSLWKKQLLPAIQAGLSPLLTTLTHWKVYYR